MIYKYNHKIRKNDDSDRLIPKKDRSVVRTVGTAASEKEHRTRGRKHFDRVLQPSAAAGEPPKNAAPPRGGWYEF